MSEEPIAEAGSTAPPKKRTPRKKAAKKKVAAQREANETAKPNEPSAPADGAPNNKNAIRPSKKSPREDRQPGGGNQPDKDRSSSPPQGKDHHQGNESASEGGQYQGGQNRNNNEGRSRRRRGGRQRDNHRENGPRPQRERGTEPSVDFKELMAKAWHIYSTEICEEGIRFVDDTDAMKLVKRSFRLAEIFLKTQPTTGGGGPQHQQSIRRDAAEDRERSAEQKEEKADLPDKSASDLESEEDTDVVPTIGEDALSSAEAPDFLED